METRASYLIVGAFTLTLILGMVSAVVWLADVEFNEEYARYNIFFKGSVTGLKTGNAVRYRGVPVGVVVDMGINPDNVEQVRVTIEVPRGTPVKQDAVASLEFQGITGVAYVQITGGTHDAPELEAQSGQKYAVIPSKASGIQEVLESAPELVSRIIDLVENANKILNAENQANIALTIENMSKITGSLSEGSGDVRTLLKDGAEMVAELRAASSDVRLLVTEARKQVNGVGGEAQAAVTEVHGLVRDLRADSQILIQDLRATVASLKKVADEASGALTGIGPELKKTMSKLGDAAGNLSKSQIALTSMIQENREPIVNFTTSGLFELTQLIAESRSMISALTRISGQIERDPARFLFGDTQRGVGVR
ncbi:MAG: MCE family protein [Alphaproteobacteria bacterium]|nr:MCE family protein [Alphaproteobacteria bacterium]